jgi:hypothetical protein
MAHTIQIQKLKWDSRSRSERCDSTSAHCEGRDWRTAWTVQGSASRVPTQPRGVPLSFLLACTRLETLLLQGKRRPHRSTRQKRTPLVDRPS